MTRRFALVGFCALSALVAATRLASASADYPEIIKEDWQLPGNPPDCVVCHQTDLGGDGTSTKPFSRSLQRNGLVHLDDGSLHRALATDETDNTDSDGDGIPDIDELQMGLDPNDGPGVQDFPIPETGCAMRAANGGSAGESATWLLSLGVAGVVVRKRRRR